MSFQQFTIICYRAECQSRSERIEGCNRVGTTGAGAQGPRICLSFEYRLCISEGREESRTDALTREAEGKTFLVSEVSTLPLNPIFGRGSRATLAQKWFVPDRDAALCRTPRRRPTPSAPSFRS